MLDSLTRLMRMTWRPERDDAGSAGPHHDAPPSVALYRQSGAKSATLNDSTASIRMPLNWRPAAEADSRNDGEAR